MALYVNDLSNWRTVKNIYIKNEGIWRDIKKGWIYSSGLWRQFYSKVTVITEIDIVGTQDVNLRNEYNNINGANSPEGLAITFNAKNNITASSTGVYALNTGNWTEPGVTLILNINSGIYVVGRGGAGGGGGNGGTGGPAIGLNYQLTINNNGVVGGGGGGGGGISYSGATAGGGGGAGFGSSGPCCTGCPSAGNISSGGGRGYCCVVNCRPGAMWYGGFGGSLGSPGTNSDTLVGRTGFGGAPGAAIVRGGFTLTGNTGDIRGSII